MDPHTGRIRAVVNSKLAFEESFRPGSTIKPLTALAALESGIIDEGSESGLSRKICARRVSHHLFPPARSAAIESDGGDCLFL